MLISDLEIHYWGSNTCETGESLRQKSINSYWLTPSTVWYEAIKDLTFETKFYTEIPTILPYDKCMVRWQDKSPKDSIYWGPVSSKEDVEKLFYTSLRCKSNICDKIYCFRPWVTTYEEFRCFWNGTLKAVSSNEGNNLTTDLINLILYYLNTIADRIPYHRCVFDICRIVENNILVFKIIEFNSWETNSGGHHIDWVLNTDMLYENFNLIYFVNKTDCITRPAFLYNSYLPLSSDIENINMINPIDIIGGDYLYYNNYIYIHNDIWLGKFMLDLTPVSWKRGIYRFSNLKLINNCILTNGIKYDSDFRQISKYNQKDEKLIYPRYGINIKYNNKILNISLTSECTFCFTYCI